MSNVKRWSEDLETRIEKSKAENTRSDATRGHKEDTIKVVEISGVRYAIPEALYDVLIEASETIQKYQFACMINDIDIDGCIDANLVEYEKFCEEDDEEGN